MKIKALFISSAKNSAARGATDAVGRDEGIARGYFQGVEHCRWGTAAGRKLAQLMSKALFPLRKGEVARTACLGVGVKATEEVHAIDRSLIAHICGRLQAHEVGPPQK